MINKKETISILVAIGILTISVSLIETWTIFLLTLFAIVLVISLNIIAKKLTAYYLDTEIENRLWTIKQYGFKPHQSLKRAFPAGIFIPILTSALSYGSLVWMASLVFDVKPKLYKAAKRHGLYSYLDITEYQIGIIAASGILTSIIFAVIGYFAGWTIFAKLSIWYAFFNMFPLSDLDGNKIFFGNLVMWSFLASIVTVAIAYTFILV